ncbi:MAG: imidazole glycerol phosphate synthase subunit HisH [Algisphaera sp.]
MIGVLDYGMGNLRSVEKAFEFLGHRAGVVAHAKEVLACERLVLPGVGNFADGMKLLDERGLRQPVLEFVASGRPVLGICMGMQLLMDSSTEDAPSADEPVAGLGVMAGCVDTFVADQGPDQPRLKVPQMGWNKLDFGTGERSPLFVGIEEPAYVYFVHGYYCTPADDAVVAAQANYGSPFCVAFSANNVHACQFHPEKSQTVGLKILDNFARL